MNITQRVQAILGASKAARNSDKELLLIYMQKAGMGLSDAQVRVFREMPSPETIRRTRQKIQEAGDFPADKEVDEARFQKFKHVRESIQTDDVEQLLNWLHK